MLDPLLHDAPDAEREARYVEVRERIDALIAAESDPVAILSTVACELFHAFAWYDWAGFYRVIAPRTLAVGPYQGTHGCLRISFDEGVCGAAARTATTQLVADVEAFEGHIPCSATTRSEIVVPLVHPTAGVVAVLDIDSDLPDAFDERDQRHLEDLCAALAVRVGPAADRRAVD